MQMIESEEVVLLTTMLSTSAIDYECRWASLDDIRTETLHTRELAVRAAPHPTRLLLDVPRSRTVPQHACGARVPESLTPAHLRSVIAV
jgi:hypothetical protein